MRKAFGAISPPPSLRDSRETPGVRLDYHVCLKIVTFFATYQPPNSYIITLVIQTFEIPICAAILAELLQNGFLVCCVPHSTVLSTITFLFCEWGFFSFLGKISQHDNKEEQFDECTGQDKSGCKKVPQGTNSYHTISYNLHEDSW